MAILIVQVCNLQQVCDAHPYEYAYVLLNILKGFHQLTQQRENSLLADDDDR